MRCRIEARALASRGLLLPVIALAWCHLHEIGSVSAKGSPTVVVDPEVRRLIAKGVARVLVELRVTPDAQPAGEPPTTGAAAAAGAAITLRQRAVLSRLPSAHFSLVRQFETVPFLALEIDADALRALEDMGALVVRVVPDRPLAPAERP